MDVEKETRIEFDVITAIIIVIVVIAALFGIAIATNVFEFEANSDSIELSESSATPESFQFSLENTHSNDLVIDEITIDGQTCQVCMNSAIIEEGEIKKVSCSNIPHEGSSFGHNVVISFRDTKNTYQKSAQHSTSGVVLNNAFTPDTLEPQFERVYKTPDKDEAIEGTAANNCPQILVTGTKEETENSFDLFLYTFDEKAQPQLSRLWDLHEYDTGKSIDMSSRGQIFVYGDTYQQTQGSDTMLLVTDGYLSAYSERIMGTSEPEIATNIYIDSEDYIYTITKIQGSNPKIVIAKSDVNTEVIWEKEIPIQKRSTYLASKLIEDKLYFFVSDNSGINSILNVYDKEGIEIKTITIPFIVNDIAIDSENNFILVGEEKGQASSDAQIKKYSPNWNLLWSQEWGDSTNAVYSGIAIAPDNTIITAGNFRVSTTVFRSVIQTYSPEGVELQAYLLRAPNSLKIINIELTYDALYAIGEIENDGQRDVYIAKFT